jgi:hypothetical protein
MIRHGDVTTIAAAATQKLHRADSDAALQAAIELMLTDRPTEDVIAALRSWADYLTERR